MRITLNRGRNIAYIHFQDRPVTVDTIEVSKDMFIDRDSNGKIYGIELLNAREQLRTGDLSFLEVEDGESGERVRVELPFSEDE